MCSARRGRRARRCLDSSAWNHLQHREKDFLVSFDWLFGWRKSRIVKMSSSESDSNGLYGFCCSTMIFCFFIVC
jgi:hypothetical protein